MKVFELALIASFIVHVYSLIDSPQVTLLCPARLEGNRGPAGVPGKPGSKGDLGSRGKIWFMQFSENSALILFLQINRDFGIHLRKVKIYLLTSCNTEERIAQNIYIHNSNRKYKKINYKNNINQATDRHRL